MEEKTYVVPPRLNEKLIIFGFQAVEAVIILALLVLMILTRMKLLILTDALLFVLWFRHDKEHNALGRMIALWKFYSKSQKFSSKEVKIWNEVNTNN